MEQQTFISCLAWIHKGYASKVPKQIQLTQQEIQQMKEDPMVRQGLQQQQGTAQMMQQEDDQFPIFGDNLDQMISSKSKYPMAIEDVSDDQKEDYYIKDTDALIVAGKIQKQMASLEVYVYEQDKNNMYVHHEIMLSSFPLDIQWLKVDLGSISSNQPQKGNYAIVASFLPQIQFWNLDLSEAIEPDLLLGGQILSKSKKPRKFNNSNKKFKQGSHTDSVLTISLNHSNLSVLASGSTDSTVKIWDISKQINIFTSDHHKNKVKKVEWSSVDVSVMFSCSQDKTIAILDSRYPNDRIYHKTNQNQTVESACWNVNNQSQIAYVTDKGNIYLFDARMPEKVCAQQKGHNSSINDVKIGSKNLMYTCSEDENVRVWNLLNLAEPLASKNPKCGNLFCLDLMQQQDGPILSVGNQKGELFVWQIGQNQKLDMYWKSK